MAVERRLPDLSPAQRRNRRLRNLAIGLSVAFLSVLFYALTMVRMGARVFHGAG